MKIKVKFDYPNKLPEICIDKEQLLVTAFFKSCDFLGTSVSIEAEYPQSHNRAQNPLIGRSFGFAIEAAKAGKKIQREGWNGKGMFVYYIPVGRYPARTEAAKSIAGEDGKVSYGAYLAIKTVSGEVIPWEASQSDMLADDWRIVE